MSYPTFEELNTPPDYLLIGASAWAGLVAFDYLKPRPTDRAPAAQPVTRKAAHSPYIGVTLHRKRWIAQYGPRGQTKTRVYPLTPEGEYAAARERALALGLLGIPMRDGTWLPLERAA